MDFRVNCRIGLWLAFLLPLTLPFGYNLFAVSLSLFCTFFPINSLPNAQLILTSSSQAIKKLNASDKQTILPLFALIMICILSRIGIVQIILFTIGYVAFVYILPQFFGSFKRSFSYGEGCLVLQSVIIFAIKSIFNIIHDVHDPSQVEGSFYIIANIGILSLFILCTISFLPFCQVINNSTVFYTIGCAILGGFTWPYLMWHLKRNPVTWILDYILNSTHVQLLFFFWIFCTLFAILLVLKQSQKATTTIRKYFHAIVVMVFTSGIFIDVHFLYLSSIVGFCLMTLLEHMRFRRIEPISSILRNAFQLFQDEKDSGELILTNIYLLAGVALPLWLSPDLNLENPLTLLSGVMCIGIGDSFASIIGSKFGKVKIFNTEKTLEGLLASVLSQIAFIQLLQTATLVQMNALIVIPIVITSIIEAFTTQVDNVALPFVMYILMRICVK